MIFYKILISPLYPSSEPPAGGESRSFYTRGQSLLELVVALGLGAVFIAGAALSVEVGLRSTAQNKFIQAASFLAQEELDDVSALGSGDWHKIDMDGADALSESPAQNYINTATSPFTVVRGAAEAKDIDGVTYSRYFTVSRVSRDASDNIEAVYNAANADPATEKITAFVSWPNASPLSVVKYITRSNNAVSIQTDWSGGAQADQMFSAAPNKFSSNPDGAIDYSSRSGSITSSLSGGSSGGAANIDSINHWAWNDAVGWVNLYSTGNVSVSDAGIAGYADAPAVGYIAFDCATSPNGNVCGGAAGNWGVTNVNGTLGGYAWNDNIGWISFYGNQGGVAYGVTIGAGGIFSGFAWNDVVGWFSFNCGNDFDNLTPGIQPACAVNGGKDYYTQTTWTPPAPKVGVLFSSIFDTGVAGGAQLNSIMWQGDQPSGTRVKFQIASSDNVGGPWSYLGPSGTSADYYASAGPGIAVELNRSQHSNKHYFRYAATLEPSSTATPRVDDIIINWSR